MTASLASLLVLLALGLPGCLGAQGLPYAVTIVDWEERALQRQGKSYRNEAARHEVLFCVEAWRVDSSAAGRHRVIIEKTRRETAGEAHGVANSGSLCLDAAGTRLPMIHTHSEGNCQFSPNDLAMIAARAARFDGVQCGDSHFAWAFSWEIKAIAASVYLREQRVVNQP